MNNFLALQTAAKECDWNHEMQLIVMSDHIHGVKPNTFVTSAMTYNKVTGLPLDLLIEAWCKRLDAQAFDLEKALAPVVEASRIPKPAEPSAVVDVNVSTITDPKTNEITYVTHIPPNVMTKMMDYLNMTGPVNDEHIGAVLQRWTKPLPSKLMVYVDVTNSHPRPSLDAYVVNDAGRAVGSAPPCGVFDLNNVRERGIIISSFKPNEGKVIIRLED